MFIYISLHFTCTNYKLRATCAVYFDQFQEFTLHWYERNQFKRFIKITKKKFLLICKVFKKVSTFLSYYSRTKKWPLFIFLKIFSNRKLVSAVVSVSVAVSWRRFSTFLFFSSHVCAFRRAKLIPAAINLISCRGRFYLSHQCLFIWVGVCACGQISRCERKGWTRKINPEWRARRLILFVLEL